MDFLKTGFNLVEDTNDLNIDDDTRDTISALMTLFIEDVVETACIYTNTHERNEITAEDMKKALMYQAQTFFDQDESLEQRYLRMLEEIKEEYEEESGEEGDEEESGEEDEEEESGEEDEEEESGEEEDETNTKKDVDLVHRVDDASISFRTWNPSDPILNILKNSINKVSV
jgi:hypothetical protein